MSDCLLYRNGYFKNWVKCCMGLRYLHDGLYEHVDKTVRDQHQSLVLMVEQKIKTDYNCCECSIDNLLPNHDKNKCTQKKSKQSCNCKRPDGKRKCPQKGACGFLLELTTARHVSNLPNLKNCDLRQWRQNHWEYAKCFSNGTGLFSNDAAKKTDAAGLISICLNNTDIRKQFSAEHSLEEMIKARNRLLHSSKLEVGDKELDDVIDLIQTILCNKILAYDENAKTSLKKIEQLRNDKLLLSSEDSVVGREMALNAIAERKDEIEETLKDPEEDEAAPKSDSEDTANFNTEMDLHKELADLKVVETKHYAAIESYINHTEKELKIHKEYLEILKSRAAKTNALLETMVEKLDEQGKTLDEHGKKQDEQGKTLKDMQKDMSKVTNQLDVLCGKAELNKLPLDIRVVALVKNVDKDKDVQIFECFVEVQNRRMGELVINNNAFPSPVTAALTRAIHEIEGDSRDIEDIKHECIAMYIHCDSLQSLVGLINQYMSGVLDDHFHPFVSELQQQPGYEKSDLEVVIFVKDFVQCLDKFLRKVKRRIGSITYDAVKSVFEEYASLVTSDANENTEMNIACGYEDQAALSETTYDPKSEDEFECDDSQISDGSDSSVEVKSGDDNVETEEKCSLDLEIKWLNTDESKKSLSSDEDCVSQVAQIPSEQERKELMAKDEAIDNANDKCFDNLPQCSVFRCDDTMHHPVTSSVKSACNTVTHENSGDSVKQIIGMGMDMEEMSKQELREEYHTLIAEISNNACEIKDETLNCSTNVGQKLLLQTMVKDIEHEKKCTSNNEALKLTEIMVMHACNKKDGEDIRSDESSDEVDNLTTNYDNVCCISHEHYPMLQAVGTLDDISKNQEDSKVITDAFDQHIFENTSAPSLKKNCCSTYITSCNEQAAVQEKNKTEEEEVQEQEDYNDKLTDERVETYEILKEAEEEDEGRGRDFVLYHNKESITKNKTIRMNSTTDTLWDDEEMLDCNDIFDRTKGSFITSEGSCLERNIYPSFEDQCDEEELANFYESNGFHDNIKCCRVTLEQDLVQRISQKKYEETWNFQINNWIPLRTVSLMECAKAENFNISEIIDDDKAVPGIPSMCQSWTMTERPGDGMYKYSVKVHFNSLCYGEFQQTVKFDFGSAVELQTMRVNMKPIENIEEIKLEYLTYHGKQWNAECCDIIPFTPNMLSIVEKDLLEKFPLMCLSTDDYATEVSGELTRENYRYAMHKMLYAEEYDRKQRIAEFNIDTYLTHASESADVTSFEGRVEGYDELYANIKLNDDFKTDTLAAQLIFRDTNCVLIRPRIEGTQTKVYEAIILKRQHDSLVVQLTDTFVNDVGFSTKNELPIQVQMQLNRSNLCKMHNAIDNLGGLHLVLPERFPHLELAEAPLSPVDDDLAKCNKNQRDAILKAAVTGVLEAPPLLIVGPFGTGKTFTIAQATKYIIHKESTTRVLICTHSNSEADIYIKEYFDPYVKTGHEEARPLRVLYQHRWTHTVSEDVKPYCLLKGDVPFPYFRHPTIDDIKTRRIVVTTMGTADVLTHVVPKGFFTHIFLDEAAQVLETELLIPLSMAGPETRVILAGDYMQMSPVVYSQGCRRRAFHTSLIERLNTCYPKDSLYKIILCDNYRSNSVIVDFTSAFYDYPLRAIANPPPHNEIYPLAFFSVRGGEVLYKDNVKSGYYNEGEVREVVEQVQHLKLCWPKEWDEFSERNICVVAPYQIQIMYIRQELRKKQLSSVAVDRIENVQGKQFRVIIISTVRTKVPEDVNDERLDLGFFSNIRLCNTAITRAQSQVITIGDPIFLCGYGHCRDFWEQYIQESHHSSSFFGIEWERFEFKRKINTFYKSTNRAFPFTARQRHARKDIGVTGSNSDKHSTEIKEVKFSHVKADNRADHDFVQTQESYHQIQSIKDDCHARNAISWQNIARPESKTQRDDRTSLNNQENALTGVSNQHHLMADSKQGQSNILQEFYHQNTSTSDFNQQNILTSNVHQTQRSSTEFIYTQAPFSGSSHSEMSVDFPPPPFVQQYDNALLCGYPTAPIDANFYHRYLNVLQQAPQNNNTSFGYQSNTGMGFVPSNIQANAFDSSYQSNMNSNWTPFSNSFQDPNMQPNTWVPSETSSFGAYGNEANSCWPKILSDNQQRFMYHGNNLFDQNLAKPVGNTCLNFIAMPEVTCNFPTRAASTSLQAPSTFIPLRIPVPPISTTLKQPAKFQPHMQPTRVNRGVVLNAGTEIVGQKRELEQMSNIQKMKRDEWKQESRGPIPTTPDREHLQTPKLEHGIGLGSSRTLAHKNETESHEKRVKTITTQSKYNTDSKETVQTQEQPEHTFSKIPEIMFGSIEGSNEDTAKNFMKDIALESLRTPAYKSKSESHERSDTITPVEVKSNTEVKQAAQTQEQSENIVLKIQDITFGSFEGSDNNTAKNNTCAAKCKEYKVMMPRLARTQKTTRKETITPINDEMRFKTKQKTIKDMSQKSDTCKKNGINDQKEAKHDESEHLAEPGHIKSYSEAVQEIRGKRESTSTHSLMALNMERLATNLLPNKQDEGLTAELCESKETTAWQQASDNNYDYWMQVQTKKYPRLPPNGQQYSPSAESYNELQARLLPMPSCMSETHDRLNTSSVKTSKPHTLATSVQNQGSSNAPLPRKPRFSSNIFVRKREAVTLGEYFPKSGN